MRARPPPAQDFISILQKFKLAINLLVSEFSFGDLGFSGMLLKAY